MSWQQKVLHKYYYSGTNWISGSDFFRQWIDEKQSNKLTCLELGPGPGGKTSKFLKSKFNTLEGLDIDPDIIMNESLDTKYTYDGRIFPMSDNKYDCVVCDYVLEHVEYPEQLLSEVYRVLKPNGHFIFRTPNFFHYVSIISHYTPFWFHKLVAHRLRNMPADSHDVYPTFYRINSSNSIFNLATKNKFEIVEILMIEKEPSYGMFSPLLFYPFMIYERIVNSSNFFKMFRANILGCLKKVDHE